MSARVRQADWESVTRIRRDGNKKGGGVFPPTASYRPFTAPLLVHSRRIHAHLETQLALVLEFDVTVDRREQRVVRGPPHVLPRMELRAALDHDDAAGGDEFAAETLHAEVFRIGVAPVARGADALFVSHAVLSRLSRRRS